LGAISDERAQETLLRIALRDKDEAARREASRALVKSRGISDAEEPVESLKDRDPFVRANAAALLESTRQKKALGPLAEATLRDPDRKVRRSAARALGAIDGNLSANLLADALSDNDSDVRKNAVDAFALIGGIASVKPLIAALSDRNFRVRAAAATALGELRARNAVDPLIERLNDPSPKVVHAASTSLESIADQNFGTDYEQWKKWDRNE
jgi:HEAT repeat protein